MTVSRSLPARLRALLRLQTPLWVLPLAPPVLLLILSGCTGIGNRAYVIDGSGRAPVASAARTDGRQPAWILAAVHGDGPGDPLLASASSAEPVRDLPKSRSGNPREYSVFGKSYRVLDSAAGFREQGKASWYGRKFHGRPTASGEPYDMHAMTAAHKHLPIPTFVQVTNLDNGRQVTVRVNDRGPFVDGRIIDLSFAAAEQLDMTGSGTANVAIQALSVHLDEAGHLVPDGADPAPAAMSASAAQGTPVSAPETAPDIAPDTAPDIASAAAADPASDGVSGLPSATSGPGQRYVQAGAFHDTDNAHSLSDRLSSRLATPVEVAPEPSRKDPGSTIFRVQIGPFDSDRQVRKALTTLAAMGVEGYETRRPVQNAVR